MCKSSPTTYAEKEKVTIDTGNYLLDDVNAIMAENTESKLEILIPINNIATALNAKNNLFFLILIYVAFGMSQAIFLYTGFMDGISRNLDEAAIIDGCNNWQPLWKILFPVCKADHRNRGDLRIHLWIQ